jgi:hypothetical protein
VGFVPVYLSSMHRATSQANSGCSLQFSPTTSAVAFPKSRNIANRRSNGDWLDTLYLSDDLEVHAFPYATKPNARLTNSIWFRIELHNFCIARLKKMRPTFLAKVQYLLTLKQLMNATNAESSFSILSRAGYDSTSLIPTLPAGLRRPCSGKQRVYFDIYLGYFFLIAPQPTQPTSNSPPAPHKPGQ